MKKQLFLALVIITGPVYSYYTPHLDSCSHSWVRDRLCPACRAGEENLCDNPKSLGIYTDGGYAEYILVTSHRYLIRSPDDMDIDASSVMLCVDIL